MESSFTLFICMHSTYFDCRTHTRGRRRLLLGIVCCRSFNPRTHTGCDMMVQSRKTLYNSFQSTHPHRVRRSSSVHNWERESVSIHAPTQGATSRGVFGSSQIRFNPRTHTGCDLSLGFGDLRPSVSIHAPTQGATCAYAILIL